MTRSITLARRLSRAGIAFMLALAGCLSNPLPYLHTPEAPREKQFSVAGFGTAVTLHAGYSPNGRAAVHAGGHFAWLPYSAGLFGTVGAGTFLGRLFVDGSFTAGRFYSFYNVPASTYPGTANDLGGLYNKWMLQLNYPFRARRGGVALGFSSFKGTGETTYQYGATRPAALRFPLVLEPTLYLRAGRRQRLLFVLGSNLALAGQADITMPALRLGMGYDVVWR